jgi:hypothetical protein
MCLHIVIYVNLRIEKNLCIYIYLAHADIFICICKYTNIDKYVCIYVHIYICIYIYMYIYMYICIQKNTKIRIYAHEYI